MARLIITTSDGKRAERDLSGTLVVGRSKDCDLPLPEDAKAAAATARSSGAATSTS